MAAEGLWVVIVIVVTILCFGGHNLSLGESLVSGWPSEATEALSLHLLHNHTEVPSSHLIPQSGFKFAFNSVLFCFFLFKCH